MLCLSKRGEFIDSPENSNIIEVGTEALTIADVRLQVGRRDSSRPDDLEEDLGTIDGAGSRY
jgi:hypothetical protein